MLTKNIWYQIWESQNRKCFKCGKPIKPTQLCKKSMSFNIVCQNCYLEPEITEVWINESAPINKLTYNQLKLKKVTKMDETNLKIENEAYKKMMEGDNNLLLIFLEKRLCTGKLELTNYTQLTEDSKHE